MKFIIIKKLNNIIIVAEVFSTNPLSADSDHKYTCTGRDADGSIGVDGISTTKATIPIKINGAVSPRAWARPIIVPDNVPGSASGTTWWNTDWNLDAPTARAPSLMDGGTALSEALHGMIILGNVINAKVIPATNGVDLGKWSVANKTCKANKP